MEAIVCHQPIVTDTNFHCGRQKLTSALSSASPSAISSFVFGVCVRVSDCSSSPPAWFSRRRRVSRTCLQVDQTTEGFSNTVYLMLAPLAQLVERGTSNAEVTGSTPLGGIFSFARCCCASGKLLLGGRAFLPCAIGE